MSREIDDYSRIAELRKKRKLLEKQLESIDAELNELEELHNLEIKSLSNIENQVISGLKDEPLTATMLSEKIGIPKTTVISTLIILIRRGKVKKEKSNNVTGRKGRQKVFFSLKYTT